jgi:adenylate kinase
MSLQMASEKVVVYFGSFDPVHVNHLALCQDLVSNRGYDHVYLIPNPNNQLKPYAVSQKHRVEMLREAVKELGLEGSVHVYHSSIEKHNWPGREAVCKLIRGEHEGCSLSQVIGQDSYEKAVVRCKKYHNGIYEVEGREFLVYPRMGQSIKVDVPDELSGVTRVMSDYKDSVMCSSTQLRQFLSSGANFEDVEVFLCKSVFLYICTHHLYRPKMNNHRVIVLLGPPGAGKGTLSAQLCKKYPKYTHISTGDIYRQAKEEKSEEYNKLVEAKESGGKQYQAALNLFIIAQLKSIVSVDGYYIIDGLKPTDLADFEDEIMPIDTIITLNCHYKVAEQRLKKRQKEEQREDDSDENIKRRLDNYYKYMWIQKEVVNSYQSTGRQACNVSCQRPLWQIVKHNAFTSFFLS